MMAVSAIDRSRAVGGFCPPSRLRRSGAASFAWLAATALAWLAKPKRPWSYDWLRRRPAFAATPLRRGSLRVACRAEAFSGGEEGSPPPPLRGSGATALAWLAKPKRPWSYDWLRRRPAFAATPLRRGSLRVACRAEASSGGEERSPPPPRRGYGATALARLAEPKLGEAERRLVAKIFPRWNRVADWLREAERFSTTALV